MFGEDGSGQHDELRVGRHDEIVGADIRRVRAHRGLDHVLAIHRDDEHRRPQPPHAERDRRTNQAEADDGDPLKGRVGSVCPTRSSHRQQLRHVICVSVPSTL